MKIARQIAAFIGLKSTANKPAATPQPIARPASKPGGALQGLSRQPRQAERPATAALRERAARPRVDVSALRRAASGTGSTDSAAQRGEESPLPLKTLRRSNAFKAATANARVRSEPRPPAQTEGGETARPSRSGSHRQQGATVSLHVVPTGVKKIVVPSRPAPPPPEGATAQRTVPTGVKKIVLPTRPAPPPPTQAAPASQNRDAEEATRTDRASPDLSAPEFVPVAEPVAAHASTSESATKPTTVAPSAAPSTSVARPTAEPVTASAGSEVTDGPDGKGKEEVAALGQQINAHVDAMHAASNASPSQASADVLLQEAIALRELALLLSDLMRQLIQRGGQTIVSLTAN